MYLHQLLSTIAFQDETTSSLCLGISLLSLSFFLSLCLPDSARVGPIYYYRFLAGGLDWSWISNLDLKNSESTRKLQFASKGTNQPRFLWMYVCSSSQSVLFWVELANFAPDLAPVYLRTHVRMSTFYVGPLAFHIEVVSKARKKACLAFEPISEVRQSAHIE